jgi:hypothetical protein
MATNKKPTHTLRCGNIKATIWHNVSEKGPFFATTFSRPFKDQSGAWRNGTSLRLCSSLRGRPKSGLPLKSSSAEPVQREAFGLPEASYSFQMVAVR